MFAWMFTAYCFMVWAIAITFFVRRKYKVDSKFHWFCLNQVGILAVLVLMFQIYSTLWPCFPKDMPVVIKVAVYGLSMFGICMIGNLAIIESEFKDTEFAKIPAMHVALHVFWPLAIPVIAVIALCTCIYRVCFHQPPKDFLVERKQTNGTLTL